jgi:hypothetical protein
VLSVTAPVTLDDGTDLYQGITGNAYVTLTSVQISLIYAFGPNKGECKTGTQILNPGSYSSITGTGTVTFA